MALPITSKTDYVGKIAISQNVYSQFDQYILQEEPKIIKEIFNANVLNGLKQVSLQSKYTDLLSGGDYTNSKGELVNFRGLKEYMLYRIYAVFSADNFRPTQTGNTVPKVEVSTKLNVLEQTSIVNSRYNEAVDIYRDDLLPFLCEFEKIETEVTSSIDNGGSYIINVPTTKYLYDGDDVEIDGVTYTVSALVDNTSFEIAETEAGLDFTGAEVYWKPFYELNRVNFTKAWL